MRLFIRTCSALLLGALASHPALAAPVRTGATVATADMDGTGNTDIVALDPMNQQVDVLWVSKSGDFRLSPQVFRDIHAMTALAVADVNGDGRPDVIVSDGSGATMGVRVLLNKGDGTLADDLAYPSATAGGTGPVAVTLADIDGDGMPDIVTADGSAGTVSILLNNGDGTFATPLTLTVGGQLVAVAVADLNGDGFPDLVVADAHNNCVKVLLNNGDGTFADAVPLRVGSQPVALVLADVDGDGHLDILVADQGDDTAAVLLGHGDGSFAPAVFYPTGAQPGWITAQDLTGNGRLDLVTDNFSDGSVSLFANTGHGFDAQQQLFPAYGSYGTVVMSIGGTPQVVSPNVQAGQVQVTPAASAVRVGNAAKGNVRHINDDQDPASSSGDVDLTVLVLLGLAALARHRRG